MHKLALIAGLLLALSPTGVSAQLLTVQALMNDGYTVAGVIASAVGPGVFLQKGNALLVCFVSEKPGSATVATQYCKPVK